MTRLHFPQGNHLHVFCLWIIFIWLGLVPCQAKGVAKFIYLSDTPSNVAPVQEFKASRPGEQPTFLNSDTYPNPRLVVFYAHWCGHCVQFKPSYVQLARRIQAATKQMDLNMTMEYWAVSCVPNKDICSKQDITMYPTVVLLPDHSTKATKLKPRELKTNAILNNLGIATYGKLPTKSGLTLRSSPQATSILAAGDVAHFGKRSKEDIFHDAHLSFDFAMRNAIYTTSPGPISGKPKQAWSDFLTVLELSLPSTSSLQPVVAHLVESFSDISNSDDELQKLMDQHPPPTQSWSPACVQHASGYTCGLWTLLHVMSVGVVERNASGTNANLTPAFVADTLRNYLEHFFQCDDCRTHFLADYAACKHNRCQRLMNHTASVPEWKEYALWLYETHNAVNVRLRREHLEAGKTSDTATDLDVQWPPMAQCPPCWSNQKEQWDKEQVYSYLRLEYWPDDENSQAFRDELQRHVIPLKEIGSATPPPPIAWLPLLIIFTCAVAIRFGRRNGRKQSWHKK